ncbi:hypothetical protein [Alienimonas sp. DA493]|uniref:hypothetical protein n=1 Tax=Alienimonas sp. DA493 TaxID=3373605 RepID=UPI00375417C7
MEYRRRRNLAAVARELDIKTDELEAGPHSAVDDLLTIHFEHVARDIEAAAKR